MSENDKEFIREIQFERERLNIEKDFISMCRSNDILRKTIIRVNPEKVFDKMKQGWIRLK